MKNPKSLAGKTVLIVEDEVELREPLVMEFESLGCKVFEAANGVKAFEIVCRENPDLVISDIRMPGGDGISLLKKIRERGTDMPVVMLITGFSDLSFEETYDLGAEAVLSKPFDLDEMEDTVERLLTPPEQRWSTPVDPNSIRLHLQRKFASLSEAEAEGLLAMARGGFFYDRSFEDPIHPGNRVSFDFVFEGGELTRLEGTGLVRWVRLQEAPACHAGSGIEFLYLTDAARADVIRFVSTQKKKAFLPRDCSK